MVALETPQAEIGWKAAEFELLGVDKKTHTLESLKGDKGLLLMFICNHCPYVQKQSARINSTAMLLQKMGFGVAAINSNDASQYPADSYENMQRYAEEEGFCFPYLYDESQQVAKDYSAVCTPDFFGFNANLELQYRGRMDSSWSGLETTPKAELMVAMEDIAASGKTESEQNPSIGCSIKWRVDEKQSA